jgi:hypothetical protein
MVGVVGYLLDGFFTGFIFIALMNFIYVGFFNGFDLHRLDELHFDWILLRF